MITTVVQRPPPPPPFAGSQQATRCSICRANWPIRSVLPRSGSGISWCRCIPGSRGSRGSRGTRGTRGPVSGQMKTTIRGLYVRCASCREWNNLLHSPLTRFAVFFSFCFLFFFSLSVFGFLFAVFCFLAVFCRCSCTKLNFPPSESVSWLWLCCRFVLQPDSDSGQKASDHLLSNCHNHNECGKWPENRNRIAELHGRRPARPGQASKKCTQSSDKIYV